MLSFHTVARLGGISAAAEHLGMAKSGVSRHVTQLEECFQAKLLERSTRSVKLTPIGARLDQRIRSILAEVDLLDDIVREESTHLSGQVTIAAAPDFGLRLATTLIPLVRSQHPDLNLILRSSYDYEDMQDPLIDLAFRMGSIDDDRLVARKLGTIRIVVVASPDLAAKTKLQHPQDLSNQPCLIFRSSRTQTTWTFASEPKNTVVEVSGPVASRDFSVLRELAKAGEGFAFLPEFMVCDDLRKGSLVRCLPHDCTPDYPVYLTFRPGIRRIARIDAVIALAEQHAATLLAV